MAGCNLQNTSKHIYKHFLKYNINLDLKLSLLGLNRSNRLYLSQKPDIPYTSVPSSFFVRSYLDFLWIMHWQLTFLGSDTVVKLIYCKENKATNESNISCSSILMKKTYAWPVAAWNGLWYCPQVPDYKCRWPVCAWLL